MSEEKPITCSAATTSADQTAREDARNAEQRAADHVRQIRSLAQAAVQAMVTAHREK